MRAVVVRCPNCNANLQVESTLVSTTCQYCGTVSRIQARTAMFQLPKAPAMPRQDANLTNAERIAQLQQLAKMPVAVQRASVLAIVLPIMFLGILALGVFFAIKGVTGSRGIFAVSAPSIGWAGIPPALAEIDGDGTPDVIGFGRYIQDHDRVHFVAYSGKTGARLWESEKLGSYNDLLQAQYGAIGDTLYLARKDGTLTAHATKQGTVKWQLSLGEKIDTMCAQGNELVVVTADNKWWAIDAGGKKRERPKLTRLSLDYTQDQARDAFERAGGEAGDVCIALGWDHRSVPGVITLTGHGEMANIDGMRVELLVKRAGGPTIAVGVKQPGTSVPLLARLGPRPEATPLPKRGWRTEDEKRALLPAAAWKIEIPSTDPLNARFEAKHLTLSATAVFALYEIASSRRHLAAFDLATGKRLWDRELSSGPGSVVSSLTVVGDTVGVTTWQSFTTYAVADGTERYHVGGP